MFAKLRLQIGNSRLRKQLKELKRNKKVYNLDSAKQIAVVFYATSELVFDQALDFFSFLSKQNHEVTILTYFPGKETPQKYLLRKNVNVFNKKELNWYYKPVAPFISDFINIDFDILIDLTTQEIFPLRWISSLSRAKFKVGNLSYYGNPNDLIINVKPNQDLEYLISQIKHYLHLINNRAAQEKIEID